MKKLIFSMIALAMAIAITPRANADSFYFSFSGTGTSVFGDISGSGTFYADPEGGGKFLVTGATGTITYTSAAGTTITDVIAPGDAAHAVGGLGTNDNLLLPGGSPTEFTVDASGLAVDLESGYQLLLYENTAAGSNDIFAQIEGIDTDTGGVEINITSVPEPSSLLLLGTGLVGLAFLVFRKAKSRSALVFGL